MKFVLNKEINMKRLSIFLIFCSVLGVCFANLPVRQWAIVNPGASSTTIVTPGSAQHVVINHVLASVANACSMYFHTGDKDALTKVTGDFNFGANGGWDNATDPLKLDIVAPKGAALKVWFSTDPGADIMVDYSLVTPRT